jgi:hypothetical protein
MTKQPTKTATQIEEDDLVILARPSRRGTGAIGLIRQHLVANPEATVDDMKAMLTKAGQTTSDGTIKTTRMQTLSVLGFIAARKQGNKTGSVTGAPDAIRWFVCKNPEASVDAISAWLKTKGVESSASAVKAGRVATLAVIEATKH